MKIQIFKSYKDCENNVNYKETRTYLVNESFNEKMTRAELNLKEFNSKF